MSNQNKLAERVIVALDVPRAEMAEQLLDQLKGTGCYIKVGMELFYSAGPSFVESLKKRGYKVFLDLKMHDIPNTVKGGAASITRLGVDMFNVHAGGGLAMMESAREGLESALSPGQERPLLIGVTQLTSTSQQMMNEQIGIPGTVEDAVIRYSTLTKQAGLDGVVASPLEIQSVKNACGLQFITVTPGIRPAGSEHGDQSRVMTPKQAIDAGGDFIVIGRPITKAQDPLQAFESIMEEMI